MLHYKTSLTETYMIVKLVAGKLKLAKRGINMTNKNIPNIDLVYHLII